MKKLIVICLIAGFSLGCAGLRSAIPKVSVVTTDEAVDINVNSHIDKSLLCIPGGFIDKTGPLGAVLEGLVGRCADAPAPAPVEGV